MLTSKIIFFSRFNFTQFWIIIINHKNHNISPDYKKYYSKFDIEIKNIKSDNNFIGNVPINIINGGDIILYSELFEIFSTLESSYDINNLIIQLTNDSIDTTTFEKNYYFIKLPIVPIINEAIFVYRDNIKIKFLNIAGIPLNINANYPLSNNFVNGNQLITDINSNGFYIDSKIKAYKKVDNIEVIKLK